MIWGYGCDDFDLCVGAMSKRPAFQFYPSDWRNDAGLRLCSIGARGLWIEMMCLMHDATPYGHLTVMGRAIAPEALARLAGESVAAVKRWLVEMEQNDVFSRTDEGVIYSRRMVRDEEIREARAAGGPLGKEFGHLGASFGNLGGNPKKKAQYNEPGYVYAIQRRDGGMIKVGITKHVSKRMSGYRSKLGEIIIHGTFAVDDMGACEAAIHARFKGRCEGEWISAEWAEILPVIEAVTGRPHPPLSNSPHPPPSSSSPSPSPEVSEANASGGAAPPDADPIDPEKLVFDQGIRLLAAAGVDEAKARRLLGKWKRDHGPPAVIAALGSAQRAGAIDPVSFIEGIFNHGNRPGRHHDRPSGAIESRRRFREQHDVEDRPSDTAG